MRCYDKTWIIWDYGEGQACYDVLPVKPQTGPLHRSQLRVEVYGRSCVVHMLAVSQVLARDCVLVEQCDPSVVSMLEVRQRRAGEAEKFEAQYTPSISGQEA